MYTPNLIKEVERQLTVCNACRYCEGYCAVFPAIELRRVFGKADVEYIANLCHDCRDCYYACQYTPPHEFAINIPNILGQVRAETYEQYAQSPQLARAAGGKVGAWLLIAASAMVVGLGTPLATKGLRTLFSVHMGPGAFYKVIPATIMEAVFLAVCAFWIGGWFGSAKRFWRNTRTAGVVDDTSVCDFIRATGDAFSLTYLGGGGEGCTYPTQGFSQVRRWLHQCLFYGFLLDFMSTVLAAFYDHVRGLPAPYPFLSSVVLLGMMGGIGIIIGAVGLLRLKVLAQRDLSTPHVVTMDTAFLSALLLVALSGIMLLSLRTTAAMGTVLVVHLSTVFALFVTAPYGKFVHLVYRYLALLRYAVEERHDVTAKTPPSL